MSHPDAIPFRNLSAINAWQACDDLNTENIRADIDSVAVADMAYNSSTGINNTSYMEYSSLDTLIFSTDVMSPNTWSPSNLSYNSSYGFGQYRLAGKGGVPIRGGDWYNTNSGLYTLSLDQSENSTDKWIGFRCSFRP